MTEKKRTKPKIGLDSFVKAKVRKMHDNISKGRISRMIKEVLGYFHSVVCKNKFLF